MSDNTKINVETSSSLTWIVILVVVMFFVSMESGCLAGGGIHWTLDGVRHTFSWDFGL